MRERLRKTGIDNIGDVPCGTQICQLYHTKEDLIEILVPYFKAGLENNEFCVWVISQPLEVKEAKEALSKAIPDFEVYLTKGQIEIISNTDWYPNTENSDSDEVFNIRVEKLCHYLDSDYDVFRFSENVSFMGKTDWSIFDAYGKELGNIPDSYQTLVLRTFSLEKLNPPEIISAVVNNQFSLIKREGKWELIENSGQSNINEGKHATENSCQSEWHNRLELDKTLLSPAKKTASLKLSEIVDIRAVQSLMENFYKFAHIPIGLNDLKGNVLAGSGWQDICTKFHRINPETCRHCVESDTKLSSSFVSGEFNLYKCKNNLWDVTTPIVVEGQHVGYIFSGQFFFEDELLDYELFRSQARKYGFNEQEYMAAFERVPRLSREALDAVMVFLMAFASMISQLSYSNVKLSQSLTERNALVDALFESEERFRVILENSLDVAYRRNLQTGGYDYMSPVVEQITGFSVSEINEMEISEVLDRTHPDDRSSVSEGLAQAFYEGFGALEYRFRCKDGQYRWLSDHFKIIKDQNGKLLFNGGVIRDITESKQAEELLLKKESEFRTLAENSPDIITRFDRQNRHIYVNPAAEEPYGRSQEEVIGKTHIELGMDPEKVKFWEEHHEKVFNSGKPETMEFQYISPQRKKYYFNTRVVPEFIGGKVASVLAISRDISDIKEAEAKLKGTLDNLESLVRERTAELQNAYNSLRESEKSLAEAQKMSHIGNWDWNILSGKIYWSNELYSIFGLNPQESGLHYNEFLNYVHPDDRDYVDNAVKKSMDEKFCSIDFRIISADGRERIVHALNEVICEGETPVRVRGIVQDITESKVAEQKLQQSEAKYRSFIENFKGIAFEADENFVPLFLHGTVKEIIGYSEGEFISKLSWKEIIHPEDLSLMHEEARKVQSSKNFCSGEIEFRIIHRNGKIKWVHEIYQKIPGKNGNSDRYQVAMYDITERKEAEEALANLEAARQKEIHHRIKNNLQVISSLLDLETEKFKNREYVESSEVLEAFKGSQDRVISISLIHEELYKGDETYTLNFSQYLEKLVENLFQTYKIKDMHISLNLDLEESVFFDMDVAVPLGIIINELVSNSFKHAFPCMEEGQIHIKLLKNKNRDSESRDSESRDSESRDSESRDSESRDSENRESKSEDNISGSDSFVLIVSDNGVGISESFDLEQSDTLGLQLITTLVGQLEGEFEVKKGRGAEFITRFTVKKKH